MMEKLRGRSVLKMRRVMSALLVSLLIFGQIFAQTPAPAKPVLGAEEQERAEEWEKTDYHRPGDIIQKTWHWEGAKTVADVMGIMGLRLANADAMPSWLSSSRFANLERGNTKEVPEEK